ncbi:MAG: hypothetical protein APR63_03035 [Desulfuromonas sp. SDB]|nr:MAG: hypothetical protein APR63_03035 [Desulfuromonas sp. SDB]
MTKIKYINTNGIVAGKTKWKEKSCFLVCYSDDQGLINILAHPAKKSFVSLANIPVKVNLSYYQSRREHYYLREMEVINNYQKLHENFNKFKYSLHIISPIRELISPGGNDMFIFNLLDRALTALSKVNNKHNQLLILSSYYLILTKHWGYKFNLNKCVKCNSENIYSFSSSLGGLICKKCNEFYGDTEMIDIDLLKKIDRANNNSLYSIQASLKSEITLFRSLQKYLYYHFGKTPPDIEL